MVSCNTKPSNSTSRLPTNNRAMIYQIMSYAPTAEVVISSQSFNASSELPDLTNTNGQSVTFTYTLADGTRLDFMVNDGVVFTGDIILGNYTDLRKGIETQEAYLSDPITTQAAAAAPYCNFTFIWCWQHAGNKWSNGVVPYEFENRGWTNSERQLVLSVIAELHQKTPLRFRARNSSDNDYVLFTRDGYNQGCFSFIGRTGGMQRVALNKNSAGDCLTAGVIRHEIGHAIGLIHEHQRSDRDNFVTIYTNNIQDGKHSQFTKFGHPIATLSIYDYDSIMHYNSSAFAKPYTYTIRTKPNNGYVGYNDQFSSKDLDVINLHYR